ncbi:hypothetical protein D3C85_1531910 [compost metagenome]
MAVVAADIVLLRRRTVQQAAGLQEKLLDVNVGWQRVAMQVGEVIQLGIIAKHSLNERFQETPLQPVAQ